MPKNIVLCFDGTDNSVETDCTNVMRLFRSLERSDRQLIYYAPGVGTLAEGSAKTWTGRLITRLIDSAIGHTLRDNFCRAYTFLVHNYVPGDHVFIFGFSRGAYTARALASGLHAFGLVYPEHENLVPYVWSLLLNEQGLKTDAFFQTPEEFKKMFTPQRPVPVQFVGVWDTVSSLGWLWDYRMVPYTSKNPSVRCVRHAVSIDERRAFFRSNLYCYTGQEASGKRVVKAPIEGQDLKEVWFAGVHSDVGGGYPDSEGGLSKIALRWMLREAQVDRPAGVDEHGAVVTTRLLIDSEKAKRWLGETNELSKAEASAMDHKSLTFKWWLGELLMRRTWDSKKGRKTFRRPNFAKLRTIGVGSTVHESVQQRLEDAKVGYKPKNLPGLGELKVET